MGTLNNNLLEISRSSDRYQCQSSSSSASAAAENKYKSPVTKSTEKFRDSASKKVE